MPFPVRTVSFDRRPIFVLPAASEFPSLSRSALNPKPTNTYIPMKKLIRKIPCLAQLDDYTNTRRGQLFVVAIVILAALLAWTDYRMTL